MIGVIILLITIILLLKSNKFTKTKKDVSPPEKPRPTLKTASGKQELQQIQKPQTQIPSKTIQTKEQVEQIDVCMECGHQTYYSQELNEYICYHCRDNE